MIVKQFRGEKMLIIGELLNSTRDGIKKALLAKDEEVITLRATEQIEAGADYLDVNASTSMENEIEDLKWMIDIIQNEVDEVHIAVDTSNPEAMEAGLKLCKHRPMVNSINNQSENKKAILPLVKEYDAEVIGLTMGKEGMPSNLDDRLREAEDIVNSIERVGLGNRLYLDPLVMSIGSNQDQARITIKAIRRIKEEFGVKTSVGLSNVSFGAPDRALLNRTYLAMLLEAGLDAALIDPTDSELIDTLYATNALLGKDERCREYLEHYRKLKNN